MIESIQELTALRGALDAALASGVARGDIVGVVATAIADADVEQLEMTGFSADKRGHPIFDELPPGFIDLPAASKKYGVNRSTMHHWVKSGQLPLAGRLRGSATGGGYLVLREAELIAYMAEPRRKGGRPRKQ